MTTIDNGGPAFSHPEPRDPHFSCSVPGLTKREWFAGQALVGIIANPGNIDAEGGAFFAKLAYQQADAMIEASKKGAQE